MSEVLGNPEVKVKKRPGPKPRQRSVEDMTERDRDQAGLSLDPREAEAHEPKRPKRVTMQGAMKLSIPDNLIKENYTPRWFRDKDARIAQAIGAYWEHIKTSDGKNLSRPSGPFERNTAIVIVSLPDVIHPIPNRFGWRRIRRSVTFDQ